MKKIFIQFRQWVLRHRKKLIYGAFVLLIGQICFFSVWWFGVGNEVFAVDWNKPTENDLFQQQTTEWYEKLSFLTKVVYVLVYPLLVLAWKLADNSMVYWEIFWFDTVLWQLWNILKNFANFTLWFIIVYKIFEILLVKKEANPWDVRTLLINSLIAWVWIQASWFIIASLIDISTILAYSIWGLPISVLKGSANELESIKYNPYVLKNVINADVKDIDTVHMYLTNTQVWDKKSGEFYISECETFSYKYWWTSEELILAPKMIYYNQSGTMRTTDNFRCHYYGQVYYFNDLYKDLDTKFGCSTLKECEDAQIAYQTALDTYMTEITSMDTNQVVGLITSVQVLQIWDAHTQWWVIWSLWPVVYTQDRQWLDLHNKWTGEWWTTSRLQDIMDGNTYVWIFTALYSSLLSSWRGIIPPDAWTFAALLNVALSLWYVLAIWIPLIAVAVVFIMRIGILWMAVVLSPFIVLSAAFKEIWEKIFKSSFLKYLSLEYLIPIIFAPAIICFAISISTVLVAIISWLNVEPIKAVEPKILWWLIELDIGGLSLWLWKLVISVFWIAITWFLVWTAISVTKLWDSEIIKWIKGLAESALWSIPIVPVIWTDENWKLTTKMIWTTAAFKDWWIVSKITEDIKQTYNDRDSQILDDFIRHPENVKIRRAEAYKDAIVNFTPTTTDWTTENITIKSENWTSSYTCKFTDVLASKKEDIIKAINGLDENKRKAFGASNPRIVFNNWKNDVMYEFNSRKDANGKEINLYELKSN